MRPSHFLGWLIPIITVVLSALSSASGQTENPCDKPNALPQSFFEVPVGPQGDWQVNVLYDQKQEKDRMVPVVVTAVPVIQGPAQRRGLRLGCGVLRNVSERTVMAVQLRWILVRNENRSLISQNGYTAETVLQAGYTPEIQVSIPSNDIRRTDFSILDFATMTEPLTKNGKLTGVYWLFVGVNQVRFADGSVWNAEPLPG